MKKLFLATFLFLLFAGYHASAQTYEVPKDYVLKAKEDYSKYEDDVIKTVDWLQKTSWSEQTDKRKEANGFLVAWLTGSPDVSISVGSPLVKLTSKNPELMISFMGGYARYAIQHKGDFNQDAANAAGLKQLMDKYANEPSHKKDNAIEKLIKINQDGKLNDWIKNNYYKS